MASWLTTSSDHRASALSKSPIFKASVNALATSATGTAGAEARRAGAFLAATFRFAGAAFFAEAAFRLDAAAAFRAGAGFAFAAFALLFGADFALAMAASPRGGWGRHPDSGSLWRKARDAPSRSVNQHVSLNIFSDLPCFRRRTRRDPGARVARGLKMKTLRASERREASLLSGSSRRAVKQARKRFCGRGCARAWASA